MTLVNLDSDRVSVGLAPGGAQLWPVKFRDGPFEVQPMHQGPWRGTSEPVEPPMLANLAGDFLCAPFGASDVLPEEHRDHGLTANGEWRVLEAEGARALLELKGSVAGARVTKEVVLRAGHPVVYQRHTFTGGTGRLPVGHHAMLRAPDGDVLNLSFSRFAWCGTPPQPVESDPARGRSLLVYPQRIEDLRQVAAADGSTVDVTSYPPLEGSEEIVQLVTDPALPFAWSAAVAPGSGWVWFAVRRNGPLRSTMLWLSNGGRDYPPFSGRHRRVIGIEEVTSFFHHGHRASISPNPLEAAGHPTSVHLKEGLEIGYALGCVTVSPGFMRVMDVRLSGNRLTLEGNDGIRMQVPFDSTWL